MAKNRDPKKVRAKLRKNRSARAREQDWTRRYHRDSLDEDQIQSSERVSGKGEMTRHRTIVTDDTADAASSLGPMPSYDSAACVLGRVLSIHGLSSLVQTDGGQTIRCATRRLLKSLETSQRHVVAVGDRVVIRISGEDEGIIERIEPRFGTLSRTSRGRQHVMVANVDQLLIIGSAAEPDLKPHLLDRMVLSAETAEVRPVVCINKIDLIDAASLQPLIGVFGQLGYDVYLISATHGIGLERLKNQIAGRQTAVVGQSGVGKTSLLNAIEPGLGLKVRQVSAENEKGRHTTTAATLVPLTAGGYMVDTPGIRQFQLWDIIGTEVAGLFRDIRPFVSQCRFPDCTHTHEADCGVKNAVADGYVDLRRYESYCQMCAEE